MPFIRITVLSPSLTNEQMRRLEQRTTEFMISGMRKPIVGVAVLVEHVKSADWSIADERVAVAAHVEATMGQGTNTAEEKARFMADMWELLRSVLGPKLREETYVVFHEIDTKTYGRGGVDARRTRTAARGCTRRLTRSAGRSIRADAAQCKGETVMNDSDVFDPIRVVDFSQGMAGPYCAQLLAQYGADVVKVEPPTGDWLRNNGKRFGDHSAMSMVAGRGKRSLALDLKSEKGQAIARRLIAGADIIIENNRPGVMTRLGLDYAAAKVIKPDIIYLSLTGFGQSGPYTHRPGLDTVIQSYTGLTLANVGTNGVPHRVGVLVPDMVAALYAFQSIAVALHAKTRGRGGRFLDVSLTQAMAAFQAYMLIQATLEGNRPEVLAVPSGSYPTSDGWISLAVINEAQWPRLAKAVGRPDLIDDPRFRQREGRRSNHVALNEIIAAETRRQSSGEWLARLEAADVPHSRVNSYADWLADPHFDATGVVSWVEQCDVGRAPVACIPAAPRPGEGSPSQAPSIGEHSRTLLLELGYGPAEIEGLINDGVVVSPRVPAAA